MPRSIDTAIELQAGDAGDTLAVMCDELLSTKEAAERAGVDQSRIRQLILTGLLKAKKIGNSWVVLESDLEAARANIRAYEKREPIG